VSGGDTLPGQLARGQLGLTPALDPGRGFADIVPRLQFDGQALLLCVEQTRASFEGNQSLDPEECRMYCAQALAAVSVLLAGDWVRRSDSDAGYLDRIIASEMFRVGLFDFEDSENIRGYKHHVFTGAWGACVDSGMLTAGLLVDSVGRVCVSARWVTSGLYHFYQN